MQVVVPQQEKALKASDEIQIYLKTHINTTPL